MPPTNYQCATCGAWYPPFSYHEYLCEERHMKNDTPTSPTPWRLGDFHPLGRAILDANGQRVAAVNRGYPSRHTLSEADARLIVDAVNTYAKSQ